MGNNRKMMIAVAVLLVLVGVVDVWMVTAVGEAAVHLGM